MAYLYLGIAITAEIIATTCLKYSEGFTKVFPSLCCIGAYIVCYVMFSRAIMKINLGIAYAIWCGVGMVATVLISFLVFKERVTIMGVIGILLIMVGCILLNQAKM